MTDESPERIFDGDGSAHCSICVIARFRIDATRKGTLSQFDALTPCLTGEEPHLSYRRLRAEPGHV